MRTVSKLLPGVLLIAAVPVAVNAGVYQCKSADGSVIYQQTPCAGAQQPGKAMDSDGGSSSGQDDIVQMVLLAKTGCDAVVPGFAARSAQEYAAWRKVRADAIARVEGSAAYRAKLAESRKLLNEPRKASDVTEMQQYCEGKILPLLAKEGTPADRRFGSPQQTFGTFLAALRRADRDTALACLSELKQGAEREQIASLPEEKLRETANSFTGSLTLKETLGGLQTATAPRKDGSDHTIFFDREPNGNWKIAGI